jgi:aspartate aminotransferase
LLGAISESGGVAANREFVQVLPGNVIEPGLRLLDNLWFSYPSQHWNNTMFEHLEQMPPDPILGLSAACKADPNPDKVDLTVGVYMDNDGVTPVFEAIRRAQQALTETEVSKAYLPPAGDPDFNQGIQELLLGADSAVLREGRVSSVQTPGGCGALRLGAELLRAANPEAKVWLSSPTWANHVPLLESVGLEIRTHRYYDPQAHGVDFEGMVEDLAQAGRGDMVLIHGCCHNPCGADLSREQWVTITAMAQKQGFTPFIDFAYQGLGQGLDEDAWGLRHMADQLEEVLVASSCSKNLGLYRERTGAMVFIGKSAQEAEAVKSQALVAARRNYSMPPAHGALLAGRVLTDPELGALWRRELVEMCQRINGLRDLLADRLGLSTGRDFDFIRRENGMFSYLGISAQQVARLREEHSVYMLGSSRVNVAGVNEQNVDHVAKAVAAVL